MPAPVRRSTLDVHVATHSSALEIPAAIWNVWRRHETQANVMLPTALAAYNRELNGSPPTPGQFWISLSSLQPGEQSPAVDMVLSCTEWAMGTYPVFIFCNPAVMDALAPAALNARVSMLAAELRMRVPVERVYSVFAPTRVSKIFARLWSNITGVQIETEPYYSAALTYCNKQTITRRRQTLVHDRTYTLRRAVDADISAVAVLCKGFASTSVRVLGSTVFPCLSDLIFRSLSHCQMTAPLKRPDTSSATGSFGCTRWRSAPSVRSRPSWRRPG